MQNTDSPDSPECDPVSAPPPASSVPSPRRPLPIHRVSRLLGASLPAAERTDADRDRDYRDRDRDLDRELDRDPSYERSRAKISFTRPGFALPRVSFMTCPTKYPRSAVLPAR